MLNLSVEGRFRSAVRLALIGGAVGAVAAPAVKADDAKATQLQGVQVTGSLIRRVDTETSNPVQVIGRKAIEASGASTIGQLLEQLPMLTGDALTSQVNNGGSGDGASTISLRGLGTDRTLILLDGKRLVSQDVNVLPTNMIDRVEVLNEGAGTVYGSDAVGGVVNFITRKNFTGTEIEGEGGLATDHEDGQKEVASFTTGMSSAKGHAVFGLSYDNSEKIAGPDRDVSKDAYVLYYGQVTQLGSSRIPSGLFSYTAPTASVPASLAGCSKPIAGTTNSSLQVTHTPGTATGIECQSALPVDQQTYNYQTENDVYTPSKHLHFFTLLNENFTDNLQGYASAYLTHTNGNTQLASEAFDSASLTTPQGQPLNLEISQFSQYNPTGQDITAFKFRAVESGDRQQFSSEDVFQSTLGLRATLFDRFDWDTSLTYGHEDDNFTDRGYLNIAQLANQLGPSKGNVCYTDGTYTTVVGNCTPIDIMETGGAGYGSLSKPVVNTDWDSLTTANSNISGDLFQLWPHGGTVSGAIGAEWRISRLVDTPDEAAQLFELSEANAAATHGEFNTREFYGEFLVPVLKDVPGVKSLSLDLGTRWSGYSDFGNTTNGKYALEYRPIKDLLVRATYADIFRAPTIFDLYQGAQNSSPSYTDPCNGYYDGGPLANNPACAFIPKGVFTSSSNVFQQADSQGSVRVGGNSKLKPETGFTTDVGLVYSPNWYRPLSVSADFWNYHINNAIDPLDLQTALQTCAASGDPTYCGSNSANSPYFRSQSGNPSSAGQVVGGLTGQANIGTQYTSGVDFGIDLRYPNTRFGSFNFSLNGTYLDKFDQTVAIYTFYSQAGQVGGPNDFDGGGYPRMKFTSSLDWEYGLFEVYLRNRFVSSESDNGGQDGEGNYYGVDLAGAANCDTGVQSVALGGGVNDICYRNTGYVDYQDIAVTFKAKPIHTDFTVGVNDIFDQGAPIVYTYGPSFNYDASNYDVTGRYVYGRFKVYFK